MKMNKITLAVLGVTAITLVGCTNPFENNGSPTVPDAPSVSAGSAFDWYIKDALVFADFNDNGVRDALAGTTTLEPATTSAADGSYSLTVDAALGSNYIVVVKGGTDIATNKAFEGVLKAGPTDPIASPATTLVQAFKKAGVADPEAAVKTFLGLPATANVTADPSKNNELYIASSKAAALVTSLAATYKGATTNGTTASSIEVAIKAIAEAAKETTTLTVADSAAVATAANTKAVAILTSDTTTQTTLKTQLDTVAATVATAVTTAATAATTATSTGLSATTANTAQTTVAAAVATVATTTTSNVTTKVTVTEPPKDNTSGTGAIVSGATSGGTA